MLVLMRKRGEEIIITCPNGDQIVVVCLEVVGGKAKIGVQAAKTYTIHRSEVQARIDMEVGQNGG